VAVDVDVTFSRPIAIQGVPERRQRVHDYDYD